MDWWNDLWLNEGFASFIENLGVDSVFPDWQMASLIISSNLFLISRPHVIFILGLFQHNQFIVNTLHGVFSLDATLGSHPIIQKVENPDQITEIFDTITYSKGSSLVRMLEDFLGETIFRTAVTNYLNEYKYKNAVTSNFFAEIDKLDLDYNVTDIMLTWTVQVNPKICTKIHTAFNPLNDRLCRWVCRWSRSKRSPTLNTN